MTPEVAIGWLKDIREDHTGSAGAALDVAIEVLTEKVRDEQRAAILRARVPDPTDPTDLSVPSFERVSHIDFDDPHPDSQRAGFDFDGKRI